MMILLTTVALLHNQLLVAVLLIAAGFLGMLLQRNAFSMLFSLMLWLQGAGLICAAYGQLHGTRNTGLFFFLVFLFLLPLLSLLTFLIVQSRRKQRKTLEEISDSESPYRIYSDPGAESGG